MSINKDERDNFENKCILNNDKIILQLVNFNNKNYVHHIDGDPRNNRISNLKIVLIEIIEQII